jgi:hypothetical protein
VAEDIRKLRAWWFHRQGLDGTMQAKSAADVLEHAGWARSVGGSGPYLSVVARTGLSREAIDAAVAKLEIHELPSARGCTYVVPACDYALALTLSQAFSGAEMKLAAKLGVTEKEIAKLCDAVLKSLEDGPLEPEQIRAATGKASRSLGEEGKKKGLTTTLPLALERLQNTGEIRRVPTNGRLDQQRYRYILWKPNPLAKSKLSPEEAHVELARRYFRWIGPATISEFQWFSALGVKAARAAVEPLKLTAIEGSSERLMFADEREAFQSFKTPKATQYVLISPLDSMVLLRRDLSQLLSPEAAKQKVYADKGYCDMSGLADLPSNAILRDGEIVGLWEYDPEAESIAWTSFTKPDAAMKEAVVRTEAFVHDHLGDARSFGLDSPKSRMPRVQALRKAYAASSGR